MAKKYENIENIGKLISGGAVAELSKKIGSAEKQAADILKKLSDLENAKLAKKIEEERLAAEKLAAEEAARRAAEEAAKAAEKAKAATEAVKPEAPAKVEEKPAEIKKVEKPQYVQPSNRPANPVRTDGRTFVNRDTRPPREQRPMRGNSPAYANNNGAPRPKPLGGARYNGAAAAPAPAVQPAKNKNFGPDKKKQRDRKSVV